MQVERIRKLLVMANRIQSYEEALNHHRAIIARFAVVIVLRATQTTYRCVLKRYLRDMQVQVAKAKESETAHSILEILDVSKAF